MSTNNLGGSNFIIAPNPAKGLVTRAVKSFFRGGSIKKNYACVARVIQLWNEGNPRYASLKEFLADIQADDELNRLNKFLLGLASRHGCPAVETYRQFLGLLLSTAMTNPLMEHCGCALRDDRKLRFLLEKSGEEEPGSCSGSEPLEQMLKWLDVEPRLPPGIIF